MAYRKINFFLYPVLAIALFFTIPTYQQWINNKVLNNNLLVELRYMSAEARNIRRFGYSYTVFKDMAALLTRYDTVTLLMPSTEYVVAKKVPDLIIPEPAVFYYFTGIRSTNVNSPDANRANWVMIINGPDDIAVKKMRCVHNKEALLAEYKKYTK
jgi:hypothetical protein